MDGSLAILCTPEDASLSWVVAIGVGSSPGSLATAANVLVVLTEGFRASERCRRVLRWLNLRGRNGRTVSFSYVTAPDSDATGLVQWLEEYVQQPCRAWPIGSVPGRAIPPGGYPPRIHDWEVGGAAAQPSRRPAPSAGPPDRWGVVERGPRYLRAEPAVTSIDFNPSLPQGKAAKGIRTPAAADRLDLSVYAPPQVLPGRAFSVNLWAFLPKDREAMEQRASRRGRLMEVGGGGGIKAARGTTIFVQLDLAELGVDPQMKELYWDGVVTNVGFSVRPPATLPEGMYMGEFTLYASGVEIGTVVFDIDVVDDLGASQVETRVHSRAEMLGKGFASYSSQDRPMVLPIIQGIEATGVDVFVDVVGLRAGEWRPQLEAEIARSDALYLFWSRSASRSEEVAKEWRYAMLRRGIGFIKPVPLESPELAPPPQELQALHFGSRYLLVRDATQKSRGGMG